jgi:hypothetical protein
LLTGVTWLLKQALYCPTTLGLEKKDGSANGVVNESDWMKAGSAGKQTQEGIMLIHGFYHTYFAGQSTVLNSTDQLAGELELTDDLY